MSIDNSSVLTDEMKKIAALGASMASKGFTIEDNPFHGMRCAERHSEAWQRGFYWYGALQEFSREVKQTRF